MSQLQLKPTVIHPLPPDNNHRVMCGVFYSHVLHFSYSVFVHGVLLVGGLSIYLASKSHCLFYKALDFEIEHFGTYVWSLFTELAGSFIRMD